jgi:putative membrane protein
MMWGYGMSGFGWLVMVTWWVLVVAGIVWLVRAVSAPGDAGGSARRLLDERFAAGELTVEEYQQRRRTLG